MRDGWGLGGGSAMPLAELGGAAVDQLIARIERQPPVT